MKKLLQWFEDLPEYLKPELTKIGAFFHKVLKFLFGVKSSSVDASGK